MRASHQFPGGKGDVRDDMVQMIARDAKAANVDLEIQVYPGASLFKPEQQWNAMVNGQLDITLFPLDYASGKVRAFSATLMPGLVRNYDRAKRLNDSQFMKDIRAQIEKAGVMVLSDAWFGGGMASKRGCILDARRREGAEVPRRGSDVRADVADRGRLDRLDSVERDLQRVPDRRRRGTDTSMGSFLSFRLYEQAKCLTAPGNNALWFMYEPVLMSKKSFDKLDKKQQDVLIAGRQEGAEVLRGQGRIGRRGDDQGVQGSRRRGQDA